MRPDLIKRGLGIALEGMRAEAQQPQLATPLQEDESPDPILSYRLLQGVGLAFLLLILWAALAPLDQVARAGGMVVARGNNAVVQHAEGGTLKQLLVTEGQAVQAGQPLLVMDGLTLTTEQLTITGRMEYLEQQQHRLARALGLPSPTLRKVSAVIRPDTPQAQQAMLLPPPDFSLLEPAAGPGGAEFQLAERRRVMQRALMESEEELARQKNLLQQGLGTNSRVYAATRDYQSQAQALAGLDAELADQYAQVASELDQLRAQSARVEERIADLTLRAPRAGTVQGLRLNTPGSTIPAGATLLEIVPAGTPLESLLRLPPQHVGMVKVGQHVIVKVTAYEASHYGALDGTVTQISADAITDESGRPMYQVWVRMPQALQKGGQSLPLKAGMVVVANIITDRRTVLDYLLRPIRSVLDEAWHES